MTVVSLDEVKARAIRRERLSWLFTACLWVTVLLVGLDAAR